MGNLRFKFRAWDKLNYRFLSMPLVGIDFENDCVNSYEIEQISDTEYKMVQNVCYSYELMQFTGLFDKQGVEIYEGDIVKYDFNNLNYRIEFINAEFIARRFYENIEDLYPTEFDFGKECEVLGNIYENPELLNDELKA